jgi:hypothetical protein
VVESRSGTLQEKRKLLKHMVKEVETLKNDHKTGSFFYFGSRTAARCEGRQFGWYGSRTLQEKRDLHSCKAINRRRTLKNVPQ